MDDPSISHSPPPPPLSFYSPMLFLIDCEVDEPIAEILMLERSVLIMMLLYVCVCPLRMFYGQNVLTKIIIGPDNEF